MRPILAVCVLILLTASEARADRSRFFPTLGGGVTKASNDDVDGWLYLGVMQRPTRGVAGPFWSISLDVDIGDGAATFIPTGRFGVISYEKADGGFPIASFYLLGGAGMRDFDGEADFIARTGIGLCFPPLLYIGLETKTGLPDILELAVDVGGRETVAMVRVGWGI